MHRFTAPSWNSNALNFPDWTKYLYVRRHKQTFSFYLSVVSWAPGRSNQVEKLRAFCLFPSFSEGRLIAWSSPGGEDSVWTGSWESFWLLNTSWEACLAWTLEPLPTYLAFCFSSSSCTSVFFVIVIIVWEIPELVSYVLKLSQTVRRWRDLGDSLARAIGICSIRGWLLWPSSLLLESSWIIVSNRTELNCRTPSWWQRISCRAMDISMHLITDLCWLWVHVSTSVSKDKKKTLFYICT